MWLAKLTEKGLLRPSFVPPAPIRALRDYTRLRVDLTRERSRYGLRLQKLLEDALIKVLCVASTLDLLSVRDMLEALIAGERDPRRLAPGVGPMSAQLIVAEIGLDMTRFPTAAHLVSWAKLCPRTIQSGAGGGKTGNGNPYLKGRSARRPP